MEVRRAYLDRLVASMVEPVQDDFRCDTHREEDDYGHNHEGDMGTEDRSAFRRDCLDMVSRQESSARELVVSSMARLEIVEEVRPPSEKDVARCLRRARAAAFPKIDFTDPNYPVNMTNLQSKIFYVIPCHIN